MLFDKQFIECQTVEACNALYSHLIGKVAIESRKWLKLSCSNRVKEIESLLPLQLSINESNRLRDTALKVKVEDNVSIINLARYAQSLQNIITMACH